MVFEVDGAKLPQGDVFGGIFFTTKNSVETGVSQQVRLGTLLSITNGTPGSRSAEVTALSTPAFVLGTKIQGTYTVKNTANPAKATGFYPGVTVGLSPFGESKKQTSSLVFAGRERENNFSLNAPWLGVYKVEANFDAGSSSQSRFIVVAHPVALLVLGAIALAGVFLVARSRKRRS